MVRKAVGHFVGGGDLCRGDLCGGDLSGVSVPGESGGGARRKAASIEASSFAFVNFTSTEWKHVGVVVGVVEVAHWFCYNKCARKQSRR